MSFAQKTSTMTPVASPPSKMTIDIDYQRLMALSGNTDSLSYQVNRKTIFAGPEGLQLAMTVAGPCLTWTPLPSTPPDTIYTAESGDGYNWTSLGTTTDPYFVLPAVNPLTADMFGAYYFRVTQTRATP
jgi:hypothetical protein